MTHSVRSIAVIGAGASGIAALKSLKDAGLDATAFEASDAIGGNWVLDHPTGHSGAYTTLATNTSKPRMQYSEYPMPEEYPDFPRHDQVAAYFNDYADAFEIRDHIRFNTSVDHVRLPQEEGEPFALTLDGRDEAEYFDALMVANGHHWQPQWPESMPLGADDFGGELMHAHDYRDPSQLAGKRIVVVGMGNSATDIAVDASHHGEQTWLSVRRGAHIIPKYVLGKPFDQVGVLPGLPDTLRWSFSRKVLRAITGEMTRYGLPKPDHKMFEAHPTVSNRILDRLAHGLITVKPVIERFDGDQVVFSNGERITADLVVFCTGYQVTFPFFDTDFLDPSGDNRMDLYLRVFHPDQPRLSFIGLVQPLGSIIPLAEMQTKLVAAYLAGDYQLPPVDTQREEIKEYRQWLEQRFVASKRHTLQVDFDDYLRVLRDNKGGRVTSGPRSLVSAVMRR
ncbi:MAG: flavin-containing monooxygenase [Micrococcaceae bacterium]